MNNHDVHRQRIRIRRQAGSGRLIVEITPNEANDPVNLNFTLLTKDGIKVTVKGKYRIIEASGDQRPSVNVVSDYLALYAKEEEKLNKQKRIVSHEDQSK